MQILNDILNNKVYNIFTIPYIAHDIFGGINSVRPGGCGFHPLSGIHYIHLSIFDFEVNNSDQTLQSGFSIGGGGGGGIHLHPGPPEKRKAGSNRDHELFSIDDNRNNNYRDSKLQPLGQQHSDTAFFH